MSHDYMKQASTPLSWSLRITRKGYDPRTLSGGNKIKNILTKNGLPIEVERQGQIMPLEFIDLNSLLVAAVNCDNRKATGKEKWHKKKFEKSTKTRTQFRKKKITKCKSNFKSIKLECKQLKW